MRKIRTQRETFAYRIGKGLFDLSPASYLGNGSKNIDALPKGDSAAPYEAMAQAEANRPGQQMPKMVVTPGAPSGKGGGGAGGGGGNTALPSGGGGSNSNRDFADSKMMPYWQSKGYTVGDHAADQFGEHQNGAVDVMVPNIDAGNSVVQEALKDPNVYGIIFNNQAYGYGNGSSPVPYSAGHTGNPTQDHIDHAHIWYQPGRSDNIAQRPPS